VKVVHGALAEVLAAVRRRGLALAVAGIGDLLRPTAFSRPAVAGAPVG